jgi:hypothetical protein
MRASYPLIDDLSRRSTPRPRALDTLRYRRPGWLWLSYILFGITFWTGAGFGIRELLAVL